MIGLLTSSLFGFNACSYYLEKAQKQSNRLQLALDAKDISESYNVIMRMDRLSYDIAEHCSADGSKKYRESVVNLKDIFGIKND